MTRLEAIKLRIAAHRATMNGDEFLRLLDDFAKAAVAESIPHIVPMRTKEDALKAHEAKQIVDGGPGPITLSEQNLEETLKHVQSLAEDKDKKLEIKPTPAVYTGPTRDITEADKAVIRSRYQKARVGKVRIERGWIRRVAEEYRVDPTRIYNIIYTDPQYKAV